MVDHGVNLKDPRKVLETILNEVDLENDVFITEGVLDVLDHSAPEPLFGGKVGIDATRRHPEERPRSRSDTSDKVPSDDVIAKSIKKVSPLFTSFHAPALEVRNMVLLINFAKDGKTPGSILSDKLLSARQLEPFSLFLLLDGAIDLRDYSLVLWKLFNNVDPKRDIIRRGGRMAIDATRKSAEDGHSRPWPDDIEMDPGIVNRVRERAEELGIAEFLP
jgi:4-hydroxy-3-polyprenylbenzoate decarboxylase